MEHMDRVSHLLHLQEVNNGRVDRRIPLGECLLGFRDSWICQNGEADADNQNPRPDELARSAEPVTAVRCDTTTTVSDHLECSHGQVLTLGTANNSTEHISNKQD
jgi:hypothetical protein